MGDTSWKTKAPSSSLSLVIRQSRHLFYRPNFDRPDARARHSCRNSRGVSLVPGLDEKVPGELLARFHKGAVGHERLPVTNADDRRRRSGMQRRCVHVLSLGVKFMGELDRFGQQAPAFVLAQLIKCRLVVM